MTAALDEFVKLCERARFRNREELLNGIKSGDIVLERASNSHAAVARFLEIYRRRAEHLKKFRTEHSEQIRNDVLEFIDNMVSAPDEELVCWGFTKEPNISFSVFQSSDLQRIFGCIKGLDKRLTPKDAWSAVWGKV